MLSFKTSYRRGLLVGAAAIALSTVVPAAVQSARAEDPVTAPKMWRADSFWLGIEGAYQWVSGAKQPWISDGLGATLFGPQTLFSVRGDHALQGKIEIGFKINQRLDVAVAYTGLREQTKSDSRSHTNYLYNVLGPIKSYYDNASVETRSHMHVVDFEVGYEIGLGARGLARIHAGIRFAQFGNSTDTQLFWPGTFNFANEFLDNKTWGIGPRLGVSGKFRLVRTRTGILSLVGAVSGAVLFGQTTTSIDQQYSFGPSVKYDDSSANTILNLEGKIGIAYSFPLGAWGATITVGYRGSAWWNVANTEISPSATASPFQTQFPGAGSKSGNRFYHGPFASFRINF